MERERERGYTVMLVNLDVEKQASVDLDAVSAMGSWLYTAVGS